MCCSLWGRRVRHDKATDQHHDHNQLTIISSLTALSDPLLENAGTVLQGICSLRQIRWDFPSSSVDKNLPASAGAQARSLVQEDSTCCRATKPVHHKYWAHTLQLLKPVHLEPVLHNERSHYSKKPVHRNQRKPTGSNNDPEQPKINKKILCRCFPLYSQMTSHETVFTGDIFKKSIQVLKFSYSCHPEKN